MLAMKLTHVLTMILISLVSVGCVQRMISITSEPSGALVQLNDKEVGRTPLKVPFRFYGTYDVRLEKDGYKSLWTQQATDAPWWEAPGPDLLAEAIPNVKTTQEWHFQMDQITVVEETDLIKRAGEMRDDLSGGQ
jgi:hypothetical protein